MKTKIMVGVLASTMVLMTACELKFNGKKYLTIKPKHKKSRHLTLKNPKQKKLKKTTNI